jgi:hypothetical protein
MKNRVSGSIALFILLMVGLGCGIVDRIQNSPTSSGAANSNKTLTDKVVDKTVGEAKIGVSECDEVLDLLAAEANNPDDNFVTKAVKATFLNRIRDSIRTSVEENKNDKEELAKNCREFKTQLQKYKTEESQRTK